MSASSVTKRKDEPGKCVAFGAGVKHKGRSLLVVHDDAGVGGEVLPGRGE